VPDTWAERTLRPVDSTVDRDAADAVINELDEFAIEEGLRLTEQLGGEVTILSMGPDRATESIRKALSMGAARGVHVCDEALPGSDALVTSAVLAAALARNPFDRVILGAESTDARTGMLAAMLAERLGLPQLTFASQVDTDGQRISARRLAEYGAATVYVARWA
jgi:electron transfer flavoprotein beta subunit